MESYSLTPRLYDAMICSAKSCTVLRHLTLVYFTNRAKAEAHLLGLSNMADAQTHPSRGDAASTYVYLWEQLTTAVFQENTIIY